MTNFYVPEASGLSDEDSLLDKGIVDSTGILEVISFIEGDFGIVVGETEIVAENMDSINLLVAFVTRKRGCSPGDGVPLAQTSSTP